MGGERRNDIGMKSIISICIIIISCLFAWFLSSVSGISARAFDKVIVVETRVAVHKQKFITLDKQMDTMIAKQDTMDTKIDILIAR